ncbi:hypothetical protein [Belliella pelovolcani]
MREDGEEISQWVAIEYKNDDYKDDGTADEGAAIYDKFIQVR